MATNGNTLTRESKIAPPSASERVHPAWENLIRFCHEMGHGEIERIRIQDGLPVMAELATRKIKFT